MIVTVIFVVFTVPCHEGNPISRIPNINLHNVMIIAWHFAFYSSIVCARGEQRPTLPPKVTKTWKKLKITRRTGWRGTYSVLYCDCLLHSFPRAWHPLCLLSCRCGVTITLNVIGITLAYWMHGFYIVHFPFIYLFIYLILFLFRVLDGLCGSLLVLISVDVYSLSSLLFMISHLHIDKAEIYMSVIKTEVDLYTEVMALWNRCECRVKFIALLWCMDVWDAFNFTTSLFSLPFSCAWEEWYMILRHYCSELWIYTACEFLSLLD